MKIKCKYCGKEFKKEKTKKRKMHLGLNYGPLFDIICNVYKCPKCNQTYVTKEENERVQKLLRKKIKKNE